MDNRHNEYLDRIINFLVDDTNVDQKNKTWYPPFPTPHPHPMFKTFFNLISMAEILGPRFLMDNVYVQNFRTYFRDTYGISLGDKEFKDLWLKYLYTIKPKINGFTINESVDRKKEYLNRIVDFIVQDTEIDYKNDRIEGPFPILSSFSYLPSDRYVIDYFSKYCEDTYGLTDDEIKYVWKKYINKIVNKKPIKESVNRKQEFLDKVANFIVDDTKIEVVSKKWNPPFMTIWLERSRLFSHDVPHAGIFHRFYEYCKETYGLSDDEIMGVWNKYTKSLIYKLRDF
jgi:hypothetical protein